MWLLFNQMVSSELRRKRRGNMHAPKMKHSKKAGMRVHVGDWSSDNCPSRSNRVEAMTIGRNLIYQEMSTETDDHDNARKE